MIRLNNVGVSFRKENQKKIFGKERQQILVDVSMHVKEKECLGILGESGSGKSTMGRVICGLLKPDCGKVEVEKPISIVFQDYTTSANPRFTVKQIISESLIVRERRESIRLDREKEIRKLLELVGLSEEFSLRYPHELSGGQLQRVCIARAVALQPKIILFDESISSLDAYTQVQIMDLLKEIRKKYGLTYVFITHDLSSVTYFCDRVLFLYQGQIVETCEIAELGKVKDEYAKKLLNSVVNLR
ncbi:ABC transporter ATP-binding protein [Anaerosacchariphilus polymeriproducens]|uniref:ABC transporter ATP-binding protein n=1 Tax=Anaerosacchariphilus polymeriproducens TaxID=1812858 RepID=A0A371AW42_9FIRM|nr:dipeptide/oligopeptide/nickel ABC transporter ATP-binding protein [Anaerosacchariphilus polymeriproducens]RDU23814.1 ABC transporter ATP-binding protein [Anaerosacchariphilus polymeriproducens]